MFKLVKYFFNMINYIYIYQLSDNLANRAENMSTIIKNAIYKYAIATDDEGN